jgi:hypothetical protein
MLPGADVALREVESDPLGLAPALAARLAGSATVPGGGLLQVYRSPKPLNYERVGPAYDMLISLSPRVHFIGGDFFAFENYRAVKRDILLCSALTLALNLLVFFLFTKRWALLGLLFLGSVVSYLTGLAVLRVFYAQVFALVLAYTSTFVGFNNESLVHLAGIEPHQRKRSLLGVWSAIGTTVIGFLVLLAGRSTMIRQMALASLGGMAGFLLFLVPFRSTLAGMRFRRVTWPKLTIRPWTLGGICVACAAAVALLGIPEIATRVEGFRFQTPALDRQAAHFSRSLDALALENVVAVAAPGDPIDALRSLSSAGFVDLARHPLAKWRTESEQEETLRLVRDRYADAAARLSRHLSESGLRLDLAVQPYAALRTIGAWDFLDRLGKLGPVRWTDSVDGRRYVMAGLRPGVSTRSVPGAISVSPRSYYDELLTSFSRELGWLFLVGLALMAIYLVALQRSAARVLYVFAPLFVAALAFAAYARLVGSTLHIVHFMGFSLVIALAIDYTAVAVSSNHGEVELSKILLTGLSTMATFGVLVLARHPVLRELGATVAIGCGVSLAFALFFRLPEGEEKTTP